jgi:hypothetical protein
MERQIQRLERLERLELAEANDTAGQHGGGRRYQDDLNPSTEFILSKAEGLRTSSAKRLNGLNVLNGLRYF